jgi:biopolymer transport protein ExbD
LQALLTVRSDRTVYVRADRGLSYQRVAEVVGVSHRAGAVGVVLDGTR